MMEEVKKLKRGLKDLSALFDPKSEQPKEEVISLPALKGIHCMNVYSRDLQGDSFFFSTYLASRLAADMIPCSILSIEPSFNLKTANPAVRSESYGENVRRIALTWEQFEMIWDRSMVSPHHESASQIIFLDFEYLKVPHFEKVIPVLDKWIAVVNPSLESITDTYKTMKAVSSLNHHLEYYLIFDGQPGDERSGQLYEQFTEMASRRLGINVGWLGNMHLPQGGSPFSSELALEHLFMSGSEGLDSMEKRALAQMIQAWPDARRGGGS